jgi:MFS family permease
VRTALIAALPVLFAVWALSGLFGALGPDLTAQLAGSTSPVLGALPIAIVGGVSPVAALLTMRLAPRISLARGIAGLLAGVAVTATAVLISEVWVLLIGAAIAGVGFGLGFRGGMQLVLAAVSRAERAGALSLLYVACYLGFGVPAIVAGVVAQQTNDLTATTLGYAVLLVLLALVATAALRATRDGIELRDGAQPEGSST